MAQAYGQSSGDGMEFNGRIQPKIKGFADSYSPLTADAFTQANPPVVTTTANVSTTLAGVTSTGVLGGTVAFTRPDVGNGLVGGAVKVGGAYHAKIKPLGLFINDAIGNPFENTPGPASNCGPFYKGFGTYIVSLWETQAQIGSSAALTYSEGDALYASVNGLLTNRIEDAYEYNVSGQNDRDFVTVMAVVRVASDADNSNMVIDLRV